MIKIYLAGQQQVPENENYAYIVARGGFYIFKRNGLFESCTLIDEIPELAEQKETFVLKANKIPYQLIKEVMAFFYAVHKEHKSEAVVLLCYEDEKWSVYVPEQTALACSVKYENNNGKRFVGSIHSHPGFGTFASGTDDRDEANFDGIHLIISRFEEVMPELACYVVINGRRFQVEPGEVIDAIPNPSQMVPHEWLKKVKPHNKMPILTDCEQVGQQEVFTTDKNEENAAVDRRQGTGAKKINIPPEEQCFYCSHQEVCLQDEAEPGRFCEFFDYDQKSAVELTERGENPIGERICDL